MNKIDQAILSSSEILQSILGEIAWSSPTEGFCKCPGQSMHTTKTSERDCKIYLEPVPTITCFHASCVEVVQSANALIRRALAEGRCSKSIRRHLSPEERVRKARRIELAQLKARAATIKARIQREFPWSYAAIVSDSPLAVEKHEIDHWGQFLELFEEDEILWTGGVYDSGKEKHRENFQTKLDWQKQIFAPAPFTCPSTFVQGSLSRTAENVATWKYIVAESDSLSKDEVGAVFRWMREKCGLHLRCVIDTAGKSLHGWFEFPGVEVVEELKMVLPQLGCDPKMFHASQPCRLPGYPRNCEKYQRIVFMNGRSQ